MLSSVTDLNCISLSTKKYFLKLRAYSGYFIGLILAQIIAATMMLSGSATMGLSVGNLNLILHTYSAQIVLVFSVVWAFIISILISSRLNKDASFSFPGNRQTDCLSDFAYIITGCLFGGVTTALFGTALRIELYLLYTSNILADGFHPAFSDLFAVAAATFLYMLLVSAAGYFVGTLLRISKTLIVIVGALLIFMFFAVTSWKGSLPFWASIWGFLFNQKSLAIFALITVCLTALLYSLSMVISNRMEVRK